MKGRRIYILFLCVFVWVAGARADGPFRAHRYDSFRGLAVDSTNIVFMGNSITDMHDWAEAFANPHILNRGVSGALSCEVLANLDPVIAGRPAKFFLMIGTNDLGSDTLPQQVADNVRKIVQRFRRESPRTELYIQSILPSTVGKRTLELEQETNNLLKEIAQQEGVRYIDLWDALSGICTDEQLSLDGLHLTVAGYKVWCDSIAPYVGRGSVYPSNTTTLQQSAGLWGSFGMRATYGSVLPLNVGDELFFGDEMVKCGEWRELTGNLQLKNRGTGWGYDGTANSVAITRSMVTATFANAGDCTGKLRRIVLYTGTGDVNGTTSLDTIFEQYRALVNDIRTHAPTTPIAIVSLMPTIEKSKRVKRFNLLLKRWCETTTNLSYIDIYSPLSKNGKPNRKYYQGNYLMGQGYRVVADKVTDACAERREHE